MSLNNITLSSIVKKQFRFKQKANSGVYSSLVIAQVIAIILAITGPAMGASSIHTIEIISQDFNIINIIAFTTIWAFIISIRMTIKPNWERDIPFVGNGISNDISNALFLMLASAVAGILTVLAAFAVRVLAYYVAGESFLMTSRFILTGEDIATGVVTMIFHLILISAIGYFLGTVTRLHRLLPILLPILGIGLFIAVVQMNYDIIIQMYEFYYNEMNPWFFVLKIVGTAFLLFSASMLISRRTEVRK